jgi:hypothetical protein
MLMRSDDGGGLVGNGVSSARQRAPHQVQRGLRTVHGQALQVLAGDAQLLRAHRVFRYLPVTPLHHLRGRRETDFVEAVPGVHHHGVLGTQSPQHLGHRPAPGGVEHTDQHVSHARRVGQWPQQVEDRAHPQFATRTDGVLHGRMVHGGEHEADAESVNTVRHLLRGQVKPHAGRFQQVRGAGLR